MKTTQQALRAIFIYMFVLLNVHFIFAQTPAMQIDSFAMNRYNVPLCDTSVFLVYTQYSVPASGNYNISIDLTVGDGSTINYPLTQYLDSGTNFRIHYLPVLPNSVGIYSPKVKISFTSPFIRDSAGLINTPYNDTSYIIRSCNQQISIHYASDTLSTGCTNDSVTFVVRGVINDIPLFRNVYLFLDFGDGTNHLVMLPHNDFDSTYFNVLIRHQYHSSRSYDLRYEIFDYVLLGDTIVHLNEVSLVDCERIYGRVYYDLNGSCDFTDAIEYAPILPQKVNLYLAGSIIDSTFTNPTIGTYWFYPTVMDTDYVVAIDTTYINYNAGYRCITHGAITRHVPTIIAADIPLDAPIVMDYGYLYHNIHTIYSCDSVLDTFNVHLSYSNWIPNDSILIRLFYGDGTFDSVYVYTPNTAYAYPLGIFQRFSHIYLARGTYSTMALLSFSTGHTDTLFNPSSVIIDNHCGNLSGRLYVDVDSNCTYSSGDIVLTGKTVTLSSAGIPDVYAITDANGMYWFRTDLGRSYIVLSNTTFVPYSASYPISASSSFVASTSNTYNFAYKDTRAALCDLKAYFYNLTILRPGLTSVLSMRVKELLHSAGSRSAVLTLTLDPRLRYVGPATYLGPLVAPSSVSGSTITWNINTPGGYYSILREIQVGVDSHAVITDTYCLQLSITLVPGDTNFANNYDTRCPHVFSSFDPNDKVAKPLGEGPNHEVLADQWLEYTINFENTGNDTAFTIFILDDIDPNLDISSLQIMHATHLYNVYDLGERRIKFEFPNIMLPDTATNRAHANGEITYKIKMNSSLSQGTQIFNTANIYFDINPPIQTNTTFHTINRYVSLEEQHENYTILLYPVPTKDMLTLEWNTEKIESDILVYNANGQLILTSESYSNIHSISIRHLPEGFYLVHILPKNREAPKQVKKFIIKR